MMKEDKFSWNEGDVKIYTKEEYEKLKQQKNKEGKTNGRKTSSSYSRS